MRPGLLALPLWCLAVGCGEPAPEAGPASTPRSAVEPVASNERCSFPDADAGWLEEALIAWEGVMVEAFDLDPGAPPLIVLVGSGCVWATGVGATEYLEDADAGGVIEFRGDALPVLQAAHAGEIVLPSGASAPAAPLALTAPKEDGDVFFVIAASEIWRSVFPEDRIEAIPQFLVGVAVHELTHTRQGDLLERLDTHVESDPALGDIDDDFIEQTYGDAPGFAAAVERERASLIAAIREPDRDRAAAEAGDILAAYRSRQERLFGDALDSHRFLEDAFLTMEGVAVWSAFQADLTGADGGAPRQIAAYYDGREDEALVQTHGALFAALLDRLNPGWRETAFDPGGPLLPERLERAAAQ